MARGARAPVEGTIDPGFERVRTEFERNFAERGELGAAFAVYHRGRRVVDLWGGHVDKQRTKPWRVDSLTTVFSTTKGVSALVLAIAHSRGWLDWEARVADYWPEFAQAGKAEITVRQLLAHQAGLAAIDTPLDPETLAISIGSRPSSPGSRPPGSPARVMATTRRASASTRTS